jgi:hypothetical protein
MSKLTVLLAAVVALAALVVASGASAKGGGTAVVKSGSCSGNATWKLKVKPDDGALETEFQVDQNVAGRAWKIVIRQNGVQRFRGIRTTKAPSGSFTVRRRLDDKPGADHIVVKARALATGQTCRAKVTL